MVRIILILFIIAKGKRPEIVYPNTIESSNMVSMVLTKSATMKYQKVREYLEQK